MSDLEVAIEEIKELGGELKTLSTDLKKNDGNVSYAKDELGHSKVIEAMEEFRDNWNDHRDHLADKLLGLSDLAKQAAESFTKQDEELAKQVRELLEEEK